MTRAAAAYRLVVVEPPPKRLTLVSNHVAPTSQRAHGTRAKYVQERCRCTKCRAANRAYYHLAKRRTGPVYVPAGAIREHLQWLQSRGVGLPQVAAVSGVSRTVLSDVAHGRQRRVTVATGERIRAVTADDAADGALVDAAPTWRRIDQLVAAGRTKGWIAAQLGSTARTPALQLRRTHVTAAKARAVAALARREGIES